MRRKTWLAWMLAAVLAWCGTLRAQETKGTELSAADVEALVKLARQVLSGQIVRADQILVANYPPALSRPFPLEVQFTLYRDRAPVVRYSYAGENLLACAWASMNRATLMPQHLFYGFDRSDEIGFFVEIVTARDPVQPKTWKARLSTLNLGAEGLELADERMVEVEEKRPDGKTVARQVKSSRQGSLLPARAVTSELPSPDEFIFSLCERIRLFPVRRPVMPTDSYLWDEKTTRLWLVRSRTFLVMPGQTRTVELYRAALPATEPAPETLAPTACRAADWCLARQKSDGSFSYYYRPSTGQEAPEYDVIHHGLMLEALLDLYQRTHETRYLDAARKGLIFSLVHSLTQPTPAGVQRFFVFDEEAQLGASALTLLTLNRLMAIAPSPRIGALQTETVSAELSRFLLQMQYDDGSFRYCYQYDRKAPFRPRVLPAQADQAVLALLTYGRRTGNRACLEAAARGASHMVTGRQAAMGWKTPPAFPWLASALAILAADGGDKTYADYVYAMADVVLQEQYGPGAPTGPDTVGAYAASAQDLVAATGCKMMVVNEAARLARALGDDERARKYLASARLASGFLDVNRFRSENSFYLSDPDEVQGAFRAGIFRSSISLESNLYAIQALVGLDRLLTAKAE